MRGLFGICLMALVALALAPQARAERVSANDLVSDCSASISKCNEDFVFGNLLIHLISNPCGPDDPLDAQQAVVGWLVNHPDEQHKDAETATVDAKRALWTCDDK